jgi:preprotein translocase subunit YajC
MLNLILLQTEAGAAQQGSQWSFWIMMILIFVVFYFFMIRPQTRKQKELQQQREAMKKGDKVVTAGGIYGEIKEVQENAFIITIAKDVTIKVSKESVFADVADATAQAAAEKK